MDVNSTIYEWNYSRQLLHIRMLEAQACDITDEVEQDLFGGEYLIKRPLLQAIEPSEHGTAPVLLIDELDRADEEFEAFLLELLSDFQITIPEIGTIRAAEPPVVIITSNRTREIHDALKRRCIYQWIDVPSLRKEYNIVTLKVPLVYSPNEVLRHKDFGEMTWEEIQEAKRVIAKLEWQLGERQTRRLRPNAKGRLNLRRIIRDNLRHGGEPIRLAYRQCVYRPCSLVILCDVSGSMERYSRMLLHFVHALTHGLEDTTVEVFVFGTRLTRIARYLHYKDVDEPLDEVGSTVIDWSGGTRIGEALRVFNFE